MDFFQTLWQLREQYEEALNFWRKNVDTFKNISVNEGDVY